MATLYVSSSEGSLRKKGYCHYFYDFAVIRSAALVTVTIDNVNEVYLFTEFVDCKFLSVAINVFNFQSGYRRGERIPD